MLQTDVILTIFVRPPQAPVPMRGRGRGSASMSLL